MMRSVHPAKGKIIVFGILFWYPLAGVTYQFLHFLIGLRRLGYDPYYLEDSGRWVYDPDIGYLSPDASKNVAAVAPVLKDYGFAGRWGFHGNYPGGQCFGMTEKQIERLYREADGFLNVTGAQEIRQEQMACPKRIYVETDPVVSQIKVAQGDEPTMASLDAHNFHFSYGGNFGAPDCLLPIKRYSWKLTRQPVVLDLWDNPISKLNGAAYNTIATWQNKGRDIVFNGKKYYWSKDREFRKVLKLPVKREVPFELATGVDEPTRQKLAAAKWNLIDPVHISRDMERYRDYIRKSRGEFTVAKDQNIRLRSGWFSDRSVCYLAASRPVINQATGFENYLPTGKGLFAFQNMQEILAAVDEIESDYEGNCKTAREIAGEYFAAEKILGKLMQEAGL
jgi:hypothetical protein